MYLCGMKEIKNITDHMIKELNDVARQSVKTYLSHTYTEDDIVQEELDKIETAISEIKLKLHMLDIALTNFDYLHNQYKK